MRMVPTQQQLRQRIRQLMDRAQGQAAVRILQSQKGVALLIALFAMVLMTFIAVEVSYDTSVEYVVASQQINRIKAYYAAKAGLEVSLLRIMLYKQAMSAVGESLGPNKNMLDPIWSFPFMWPPAIPPGGKTTEVDKDFLKAAVTESLMQGVQYSTGISPEGGKIDINDLGSPLKSFQKAMADQVLKIFQAEVKNNEDFGRKYSSFRFEELINNIADYIDEDKESRNGGDETSPYRDIEEKDIEMPPNRPLRTLDELHQVAGMKDDFYNVLAPRVTIFGTKGVNINYANNEVIMALDPTMTAEVVDKVIARRNDVKLGGPFKDNKDFFAFVQSYGVNVKAIEASKIPLLYDMEYNFRVVSTGFSANVKREITVVTYDYANLAPRLAQIMDEQEKQDQGPAGATPPATTPPATPAAGAADPAAGGTGTPKQKIQAAKGRPKVVYWEEN